MARFLRLTYLLLLTSLYGCFEITEEITINKNGSGKARFSISAEWLTSFLDKMDEKKDSTGASSSVKEIIDKPSSMELKLKEIEGVKNTFASLDKENSSIGIGFEFTSINALNHALSILSADSTKPFKVKEYYSSSRRKITRTNEYYQKEENNKEVDNKEYFNKLVNSMMETASYKIVINLPSNARRVKVDHPKALIGNSGKRIILEHKLLDLAQNKETLALNIKYR